MTRFPSSFCFALLCAPLVLAACGSSSTGDPVGPGAAGAAGIGGSGPGAGGSGGGGAGGDAGSAGSPGTPGLLVEPTIELETTEGGGQATFTVRLASTPAASVTVDLASSDPTECSVAPVSLTFTEASWNASRTVTVTGVDDALPDGPQPCSVAGTASSDDPNYDGIVMPDVFATNTDNDTPGVSLGPIAGTVTESGGTASFTIVLNTEPAADVTIALSSSDPGEGTVAPSSVVFTPENWNAPRPVIVTGVDDDVIDGDQPFTIVTGTPLSTDAGYSSLDVDDAVLTNLDNDTPGIDVSTIMGSTSELGGQATFTIVLRVAPAAAVTVPLASSDPGEGTIEPASVTFTPQNWNAPRTITATGVNDAVEDGDQIYSAITGAATSSDSAYSGLDADDVTLVNLDDESAGVLISEVSGPTRESEAQATFTIQLTSEPVADVVVALSSSDTTEGTVLPVSVTFTPLNWNAPQTITVTGVNDSLIDGDQVYTVVTGNPATLDPKYAVVVVPDVTVTNVDNDSAAVLVSDPTGPTDEAGAQATFSIVLNTQPSANVAIPLSSSDTTEGTVAPTSVTFTPQNWDSPRTITVSGVDDSMIDGDQPFSVVVGPITSADPNYNVVVVPNVLLTNEDDDSARVNVDAASGPTNESGGQATFIIALDTSPTADVTIALSSSDDTEGTVSPATVTFTTANFATPQVVTVTGVDDSLTDGDQVYSVLTGAAVSADPDYSGLTVPDVSLSNLDDECVGLGIIDDMEDSELNICPNGGRSGAWFIVDDGTAGASRTPGAGEVWMPELLSVPNGQSAHGIHVFGQGYSDWGVVISTTLTLAGVPPSAAPYNASSFAGVRFWMRGTVPAASDVRFEIGTAATVPTSSGGTCLSNCYDHWGVSFDEAAFQVTTAWKQFDVYFGPGFPATFRQNGWGTPAAFNPGSVIFVQFNVRGAGAFDVWLDDVRFY